MAKRYNLAEFIERKRAEDSIVVDLGEHGEIEIPPGIIWPAEVREAIDAEDLERASSLILGDEQYARWTAAGGTWRLLNEFLAEAKNANAGE